MSSPSKLFYSSLFTARNIFKLFLTLLFAGITVLGIWLLASGQYPQFLDNTMQFTGVVVAAFILTILLTVHLSYVPIEKLQAALSDMELRSRHNQDAILRLLDEMGDLADGDLTVHTTEFTRITNKNEFLHELTYFFHKSNSFFAITQCLKMHQF